jgi:hypothetical protein
MIRPVRHVEGETHERPTADPYPGSHSGGWSAVSFTPQVAQVTCRPIRHKQGHHLIPQSWQMVYGTVLAAPMARPKSAAVRVTSSKIPV